MLDNEFEINEELINLLLTPTPQVWEQKVKDIPLAAPIFNEVQSKALQDHAPNIVNLEPEELDENVTLELDNEQAAEVEDSR